MKKTSKVIVVITILVGGMFGGFFVACENTVDEKTSGNNGNGGKPALTGAINFTPTTSPRMGEQIIAFYNTGNGTGLPHWQWFRIINGNDIIIQGANSNAYIPIGTDVGYPLKAIVSYADQTGTVEGQTNSVEKADGNFAAHAVIVSAVFLDFLLF